MTNRDVIIACDFSSAEETFRFLDLFKNEARKPFLKIGMATYPTIKIRATIKMRTISPLDI